MAHGSRGRLALLGTGLLLCIGCMNDDPKPIGKPLGKSSATPLGSNTKPTTYGGGVQQAGFTNTGRPDAKTDNFKTAGASVPTTPGVKGAGAFMAPPMGLAPIPGDPYAGSRPVTPTTPPPGFGEAQPPFAPGSPTGAFPAAPTPPNGSFAPMQR